MSTCGRRAGSGGLTKQTSPTTKPLMKFINIIDEEKEVELNILMRQHLHHATIEYWKGT